MLRLASNAKMWIPLGSSGLEVMAWIL